MTEPNYLTSGCTGARSCNGAATITGEITGILVTDSTTIFDEILATDGTDITATLIEFPLVAVDAGTWLVYKHGISSFTTSAGKVNYSIA